MHKLLSGLAAGVALLVAAPGALAAPVTVDLRIEGPTRTLFEGPVTTDVRTFRFTGDTTAHRCDGTAANSGTSPGPVPTRGAAVAEAAERTPFSIKGQWYDSLGSPSFSEIDGEGVAYDSSTSRYLVEYKNAKAASVGACADPVSSGDRVLFAYGTGSEQLLALAGPAAARPGETATVKVTDAAGGSAIAGATVGGRATGADGTAVVGPFTQRGDQDLKATKPGTIRSNRLRVCVSDGQDGFCGSSAPGGGGTPPPDTVAPVTRIALRNGAVFSRRHAPRKLRGSADDDPSGLKAIQLRLRRRVGRHCSYFSGRLKRFRHAPCGRGAFQWIGNRPTWSYRLPKRLGRGRYVLEVVATDAALNRGPVARVHFRVK